VSPRQKNNLFQLNSGDQAILQDNTRFRVYEPSLQLSGARTSYFHNAIGGYHGAKPRRFEELYDFFSLNQIEGVMDMLNVKYLLFQEENEQKVIENPNALGNAWAIDSLMLVASADEVLEQMKSLDFSNQAVVLASEAPENIPLRFDSSVLDKIELSTAKPTGLTYNFSASADQFIVFSEMYYPNGWYAEIDGKPVVHFPVDYVLRGMMVPAGDHTISFRFDPPVIQLGTNIRLITLLLFLSFLSYMVYDKKKQIKK
jgi:hypothetical protein